MKNLDQTRKVDPLGRIVIPSKLRDSFGIKAGDKMEFYATMVDGMRYLCIACPNATPSRDSDEISE